MLGMNEDLCMGSDLEARIAIIFGGRWKGVGGEVEGHHVRFIVLILVLYRHLLSSLARRFTQN
jgi:hypothetical protein